MRKFVLFAAVLAIASPGLALAGEAKKAIQMSDAEMDKVTAGFDVSVTTPAFPLPLPTAGNAGPFQGGQEVGGVPTGP
jgi:hypothetical protein